MALILHQVCVGHNMAAICNNISNYENLAHSWISGELSFCLGYSDVWPCYVNNLANNQYSYIASTIILNIILYNNRSYHCHEVRSLKANGLHFLDEKRFWWGSLRTFHPEESYADHTAVNGCKHLPCDFPTWPCYPTPTPIHNGTKFGLTATPGVQQCHGPQC